MNSLKFQDRLLGLQDNLLNFAYMLTANREEAKDLLQDTTLKALDNEDKYIDNVNFKGWVFTIMRNIFINNYRRVVRNQTIIDQTEDLYHLNLPQDSGFASPEGSFTVKEITTAIFEVFLIESPHKSYRIYEGFGFPGKGRIAILFCLFL